MSSVLKAYERFTLTQELQDQSEEGTIPPTTLKPVIRVFILTSNNPELRSRILLFCLRIVLSNGARDSHRFGALLTMFSLPSATMLNHVKLADQSPEADIERVEIDGFEEGSFRLIPNARSGMSRGEINAYAALAEDLPDTLNHATPFVDSEVEGTAWDEIETFLDMCYSVLMQAWIVTCKCMTAPDQPAASIEKRLQKYRQQGRINPKYLLQPEARRIIQNVIRKGMVVRHFLTFELQLARAQSLVSNRYYAMVGDVGKYIENCGMGGFFLTLKYALGTRWPTLALAAFSGELTKLKSLMALYQTLGEKVRYLALLESPHLMDFAAANYPLLYSYAMGIGYVLDVNMRNYAFSRSYMNKTYFQLGMETARKQQGAVDMRMAEDLGLTQAERTEMANTLAKLTTANRGADTRGGVNPFSSVTGTTQVPAAATGDTFESYMAADRLRQRYADAGTHDDEMPPLEEEEEDDTSAGPHTGPTLEQVALDIQNAAAGAPIHTDGLNAALGDLDI